jgi:hypothetical protein
MSISREHKKALVLIAAGLAYGAVGAVLLNVFQAWVLPLPEPVRYLIVLAVSLPVGVLLFSAVPLFKQHDENKRAAGIMAKLRASKFRRPR